MERLHLEASNLTMNSLGATVNGFADSKNSYEKT